MRIRILLDIYVVGLPLVMAQNCISLADSTTCSAFNRSSISTGSTLVGLFPFLAFVSNTRDFDEQLNNYVNNDYVQSKYQNLLGCSNIHLSNTTNYYARYTTSVICNAIVQNSKQPCGLSTQNSNPLCAESCAQFAQSEEGIALNRDLCPSTGPNLIEQIRADLVNCELPADALSGQCIQGEENESNDCGYGPNLQGLCGYCAASSPNATDSCCVNANVTNRCNGVRLPAFTSLLPPLETSSTSSPTSSNTGRPSNTAAASSHEGGLSGGQIAGIVVGSVLGLVALLALLAFCCIFLRRRRRRSHQGSPGATMQQYSPVGNDRSFHVTPGGRVARMDAMEQPAGSTYAAGALDRRYDNSDSDPYGESPESQNKARLPKRTGSLSSTSMLAGDSPGSGQLSSPEGVQSGQSEQLSSFQDYYSSDHIHPNDRVSVLWAYSPRAGDEFELTRGDMLKVVGIWDDGWATGVRIDDRAEDYEGKHSVQRDSGMSSGSNRAQSPPPNGEIKAFPLVCVCLPDAWRKTVEGDTSTESGDGGPPP